MIRGLLGAFSALMLALCRVKLGKETIKLESLVEKVSPTHQTCYSHLS